MFSAPFDYRNNLHMQGKSNNGSYTKDDPTKVCHNMGVHNKQKNEFMIS